MKTECTMVETCQVFGWGGGGSLWQYWGDVMITPSCKVSIIVRLRVSFISSDFCPKELTKDDPCSNSLVKSSSGLTENDSSA